MRTAQHLAAGVICHDTGSARTFGGRRGRAAAVPAGCPSAMVGLAAADVPQTWRYGCHHRV